MIASLRQFGIDARLALYIPLATVATVLATALLYSLIAGLADPRAMLPALYFFTLTGLIAAVFAWPLTLPLSLGVWVLAFTLFNRLGQSEPRAAAIAAALAGFAGAAGFALWTTSEVASSVFLFVLPGSLAGAVLSAGVLYRGASA